MAKKLPGDEAILFKKENPHRYMIANRLPNGLSFTEIHSGDEAISFKKEKLHQHVIVNRHPD